jgi:hypothetical protein
MEVRGFVVVFEVYMDVVPFKPRDCLVFVFLFSPQIVLFCEGRQKRSAVVSCGSAALVSSFVDVPWPWWSCVLMGCCSDRTAHLVFSRFIFVML